MDITTLASRIATELGTTTSGDMINLDPTYVVRIRPTDHTGPKEGYLKAEVLLKDATDEFVATGCGIERSPMKGARSWAREFTAPKFTQKVRELFDTCAATGGYVVRPPYAVTAQFISDVEARGWDVQHLPAANRDDVRISHVKSNFTALATIRDNGLIQVSFTPVFSEDALTLIPEVLS